MYSGTAYGKQVMVFTVDYRDRTGRRASMELDVPDRQSVWPELEKRGIAALSVREGPSKASSRKMPPAVRGIVAGAVAAAVAGAAVWFLAGRGAGRADAVRGAARTHLIEEAKAPKTAGRKEAPQPAALPVAESAKKKKPLETYVDEKGVERYKGGLRVQKGESEVTIDLGKNQKPDIFKNYAESRIAFLLTLEPGEMVFGEYDYNHPRFKKELENALISKIEISDEDSEEDRRLKNAVSEVKKELREALKRGEDIFGMLADTQKELQRLGQFQREMEDHIREIAKNGDYSNEDVEDYVAAANKMLAEKGIAPLRLNCVSKRALKLRKAKHQ